jgi:hypothetical protein
MSKRRLYDIDSNSPFEVTLVSYYYFKNVWNGRNDNDNLKANNLRKEWFNLDDEYKTPMIRKALSWRRILL